MKPLFQYGPSNALKLILCALASVVIMTLDHRFDQLNNVRSTLNATVYPLQYLADTPARLGYWVSNTLASRDRLIENNKDLHTENFELQAKLQIFSALEQENRRLRQLLKSSSRLGTRRVLIAELLAVDMDPFRQQIIVNKGSIEGVYVGQPLVDANGVMGQIVTVTPFSATAILISDPSHALPVQVNRSGTRTIAVGVGNTDHLRLRHIPANTDIRVGDFVSTSGLGERYPPDYPVGLISKIVDNTGDAFIDVEVRPLAQLDRGREVLLIWPEPRQSIRMPNQTAGR